jgi:hypothetical protein
MTTTIGMITAHMTARRRNEPVSAKARRLTANWQSGFESGTHVQRKLRLAFMNGAAQVPAN